MKLQMLLAILLLSGLGYGRDGTLPTFIDGIVIDGNRKINGHIHFNDNGQTVDLSKVKCALRGAGIKKATANGTLKVGNARYKVIGTCKGAGRYEIVVDRNKINMIGKVSKIRTGVKYEGSLKVNQRRGKNYKFKLDN